MFKSLQVGIYQSQRASWLAFQPNLPSLTAQAKRRFYVLKTISIFTELSSQEPLFCSQRVREHIQVTQLRPYASKYRCLPATRNIAVIVSTRMKPVHCARRCRAGHAGQVICALCLCTRVLVVHQCVLQQCRYLCNSFNKVICWRSNPYLSFCQISVMRSCFRLIWWFR